MKTIYDFYEIARYEINEKLIKKIYNPPIITSISETINAIISRRASIARYGDGEFDIIFGRTEGFQRRDLLLSSRLKAILKKNHESDRFLVALPDCFADLSQFIPEAQIHWQLRLNKERWRWYRLLDRRYPYYHAQISRFYHDWADKSQSSRWAEMLKRIWEKRSVLVVEGEKTRMGVGNDLFDSAASIRRILCPAENAFDHYDNILNTVCQYATPDDLILMALGPTATVLAYDLFYRGYQAVDIGHVDLEYEWMKLGTTEKVIIPGRYVNEVKGGDIVSDDGINQTYYKQIIYSVK